MAWKKIVSNKDGSFLQVYDAGIEGQPGYRGESSKYWNGPSHAAPEAATHTEIPDKPSEDHTWDETGDTWMLDLGPLKERKKAESKRLNWEKKFDISPQGAKYRAARDALDAATTLEEINAVKLV